MGADDQKKKGEEGYRDWWEDCVKGNLGRVREGQRTTAKDERIESVCRESNARKVRKT